MNNEAQKLVTFPLAFPADSGARLFQINGGMARAWEFNGWKRESLSWKNGCYIHAGLSSPAGQSIFRGPDVIEFFSRMCVNSFAKFSIGTAKHAIMCNDEGFVVGHGVLQRNGPEEVQFFVGGSWPSYQCAKSELSVEEEVLQRYLFQVAGPTALATLQKATGEDLSDVGFLRFRSTRVDGLEANILRVGMSGTLAYELHGPLDEAPQVYDAVCRAGEEFGLERLGWRTYLVNHVEAGFPQQIWTFDTPVHGDPGYAEYLSHFPDPAAFMPVYSGSVDPADRRARYRTPFEIGWGKTVRFDHDFVGREALEMERDNPKRQIVTLIWNPDDVLDIYASLLRPGEEYKTLDLPTTPHATGFLAHADHVLKDGKRVGWSSGTIYSYYYRQVMSHCTIDVDQAEIGNEVVVQWGDFGGRIKDVRARVERYPFIDLERNQDVATRELAPSQ